MLEQMRLNSEFYREFKLHELYPKMRSAGRRNLKGQTADVNVVLSRQ